MLVAQLCPTLCDVMDCSPPGSSVHGILQARILEWVAISSSTEHIKCIGRSGIVVNRRFREHVLFSLHCCPVSADGEWG